MRDSILRKLYAIGDPNFSYAAAVLLIIVASYTVGAHGGMETMQNDSLTRDEIEAEYQQLPTEISENSRDDAVPVAEDVTEENMNTMLFYIMPSIRIGLEHALAFDTVAGARRWLSFVQAMTTVLVGVYVLGVVVRLRYQA